MKIAVIGAEGFVGKAVVHIFSKKADVIKIDPRLNNSLEDFDNSRIDVAMICVPTPMGKNGEINASIVEQVIEQLEAHPDALVVLKSTVLPDIVDRFAKQNKNFIYNPEFLTERNANNDSEYPIMTVLGGEREATMKMEQIYKKYSICEPAPYYHMTPAEASFVKYGINSFLMTKVLFWNQFADQCNKMNVDYEAIKQAIGTDLRISPSHMNVPGHDGRKGSSGPCFGKDIPALIHFSDKEMTILREAWNSNCAYRNEYNDRLDREIEQHIEFNEI